MSDHDATRRPQSRFAAGNIPWDAVDDPVEAGANGITANDIQIAGDHYKSKTIQPWDYIASNQLGYFEGNIVKYVSRWKDKGGVNDLLKAQHYLQKLIELEAQ